MGLMTGLAIGGLTAMLAQKKLKKKEGDTATPPAPVAPPPSGVTDQTPKAPLVDPAADNAAAQLAGEKQRKRAALGGMAMRPIAMKKPGVAGVVAKPKSLIGGY